MAVGAFEAQRTERLDDGCVCHCDGHPLRLRCVRPRGEIIDVLDGGGFRYTSRLQDYDA